MTAGRVDPPSGEGAAERAAPTQAATAAATAVATAPAAAVAAAVTMTVTGASQAIPQRAEVRWRRGEDGKQSRRRKRRRRRRRRRSTGTTTTTTATTLTRLKVCATATALTVTPPPLPIRRPRVSLVQMHVAPLTDGPLQLLIKSALREGLISILILGKLLLQRAKKLLLLIFTSVFGDLLVFFSKKSWRYAPN